MYAFPFSILYCFYFISARIYVYVHNVHIFLFYLTLFLLCCCTCLGICDVYINYKSRSKLFLPTHQTNTPPSLHSRPERTNNQFLALHPRAATMSFAGIPLPPCVSVRVANGLKQRIEILEAQIKDQKIRELETILTMNKQHTKELAVRDEHIHQLISDMKDNSAKKAKTEAEAEQQIIALIAMLQENITEAITPGSVLRNLLFSTSAEVQPADRDRKRISSAVQYTLTKAEADDITPVVRNAVGRALVLAREEDEKDEED